MIQKSVVVACLVALLGGGEGVWCLLSSPSSRGPGVPGLELIHRVVLDQQGAFVLLWTPRDEDIVFEVQVRTLGYVGLGFSPSGGMSGADVVVGWVDRAGKVHFTDRHATGNRTPSVDASQDYTLLGGAANDTHTTLRFSRPWLTCDEEDDVPLTEDTVRVIYAYDAVLPDPSNVTLSYHDYRGTKSLYLREPRWVKPDQGYDGLTWDVRAPEVEIPSSFKTLYWCKLYKIPDLAGKHQMIGYVPLISESSLPHVHHMLLFECTLENSDAHLEKWVGKKGAQCYGENMPLSWSTCGSPIVAWAIGSTGEMLPENVGFPLGEQHGGATYFLLEIHYDNPKLKTGLIDTSGLRLLLTDRLRRYDAGMLTVGHKVEPSMIIPPRKLWTTSGHCTGHCTQATLPPDGIRAFSAILHAHLLGTQISLRHIRDGVELTPLVADDHYDFSYQQARVLDPPPTIRPGDHLITTCTYNATHKNKPTFGGFATDDEMCLVFVAYFPRLDLSECYSRPDIALLFSVFGVKDLFENDMIMKVFSQDRLSPAPILPSQEDPDLETMTALDRAGTNAYDTKLVKFFRLVNISEPAHLRGKSFYDLVTSDATWRDETLISRLQEAISKYQYEPTCLYTGRKVVQGLPKKAKYPPFSPFRPPLRTCRAQMEPVPNDLLAPMRDEAARVRQKFQGRISEESARQKVDRSGAASMFLATPLLVLTCLGVGGWPGWG